MDLTILQDDKRDPMRPITVQPGHTENELHECLASRQFVYSDCYTVEPLVGDRMRYTTAQRRVTVLPADGDIVKRSYEAQEILITGLRTKSTIGIEVDEQSITINYPDSDTAFQNYLSWPFALKTGRMDGGKIRRDRFIAKEWNADRTDWIGGFPMFVGLVAGIDNVGRSSAQVKVKSNNVLLNVNMPRDLWQPGCKNTWGDSICGVNQLDWSSLQHLGAASTRSVLQWAGADANYNQGKVHIDNGGSVTRIRTISRVEGDKLFLAYPLDFDPFDEQEFFPFPGCPKTTDPTFGCPKYHGDDWRNFFKGFPFIPVAETAAGGGV